MSLSTGHHAGSPLSAVNLYTSTAFLDVMAQVYFPGETCRIQDHVAGGQVFRLLDVQGRGPVLQQHFLDLHEAMGRASAHGATLPRLPRLMGAGPMLPLDAYRAQPNWERAEGAPTVLWAGFDTWADYLNLLRQRHVEAEDRRRGRRMEESLGPTTFQVDDVAPDVLPTCWDWKSRRDLSLGRADLFATATHRQFFAAMREAGLLRASTLRAHNGELLSIWLGAVHARRWSGWVFTFNPKPDLARLSLGRQLLHHMLHESHQAGHIEFDFSIGMEPYKLTFATHVRPIGLVGRAPAGARARNTVKQLLQRSPWCYDQALRMRNWLVQA
jgi:hypothetical protein